MSRDDDRATKPEARSGELTPSRSRELVEEGRRLVAEFEAEHGPIAPEALAAVDAEWPVER